MNRKEWAEERKYRKQNKKPFCNYKVETCFNCRYTCKWKQENRPLYCLHSKFLSEHFRVSKKGICKYYENRGRII